MKTRRRSSKELAEINQELNAALATSPTQTSTSSPTTSEAMPSKALAASYDERNKVRQARHQTHIKATSALASSPETTSPELASLAGKYVALGVDGIVRLTQAGQATAVATDFVRIAASLLTQAPNHG